jgi:hypothetical protein
VRVEVENRGERPPPADGPVRFLAWGDCRGGVTVQERLADLVRARRPDFVVGLGDFVGMARTYQFEILRDRFEATGVPFFAVPGNHDLDPFGTLRPWARVFGPRRWSFLERGVLLAGLDTARGAIEPEDAAWLAGVAEAARQTGGLRHLVLCLHHPLWPPEGRPDKPLPQGDAATRRVQDLCAWYGALVLCSHWHGWEARTIGAGHGVLSAGVTQVVTGGAGSRLEAEVPYHAVEATFGPDGPRVERIDLGRADEVSERVDRWKTFRDEAAWAARHRPLAAVPAFLLLALGLAGLARAATPRPKAPAA